MKNDDTRPGFLCRLLRAIMLPCFVLAMIPAARAGSPATVTESGYIVSWEDGSVTYHPETGRCSTFTNANMLGKLDETLLLWENAEFGGISLTQQTGSIPEINGDNFTTYMPDSSGSATATAAIEDGFNPVAFDEDGEITDGFFGENAYLNVLGFAGATAYDETTGFIQDALMVLNCRCVGTHPIYDTCESGGQTISLSEFDLDSTIVHEFGHLLGLDHSQVNADAFATETTDDNNTIPIMYPIAFTADELALTTDDAASLAVAYLNEGYTESRCTITGSLTDTAGDPLRCADVQAIPNDPAGTISFVSGAFAPASDDNGDGDTTDTGECQGGCGMFFLYVEPNTAYTIMVKPIDPNFVGGSSLSPCRSEQNSEVEEEEILEVSSSECSTGGTLDLHEVETQSGGGTSGGSDDSDDSSGSSTGTTDADSFDNTGGGLDGPFEPSSTRNFWCALDKRGAVSLEGVAESVLLLLLPLFFLAHRRYLKSAM